MYKLIAVDLDGTMLNSYGEISKNTKESVKKCLEKGMKIVIASGRPIDSIKAIAKELELEEYCIAGNGSLIYNLKDNKIIYENCMKKEKVLEIIKICEENSISYNVYTENTILAVNFKYNVLYYHKENLKKEEDKQTNISIVENMYNYVQNLNDEKFLKITICDEDAIIFNSIIKKMKKIENVEVLETAHMSRKIIRQGTEKIPVEYYYTEISAQNVDKWDAVKFLAEKLSVNSEEIIAIGDNVNDKKMIENAGLGVAMRGSAPVVENIANVIADSNDEDGVAKILKRFI